ncbi:hypothetical protein Hanom_Chr01g00041061 [Helianthus anomalus]
MRNCFSKKKPSGVEKALNIKLRSEKPKETDVKTDDKLPENIDITYYKIDKTDDVLESEIVKNVLENVFENEDESDSESTKFQSSKECFENDVCYFNNYIPMSKNNLSDDPTLVMY